jgi:hypothetical protein
MQSFERNAYESIAIFLFRGGMWIQAAVVQEEGECAY